MATCTWSEIVQKIKARRVTFITGKPGSGKSSQVPRFLLDEGVFPVLCTLPRRFAVVSVAKMVAQALGCEVGEKVGYHIGHSMRISTSSSKIVFKTTGVLLGELREKGIAALNKYKAIILDEVHERSVESDLVLVCVKQFLLKSDDLRLVLMSATADRSRYCEYFSDLGSGEVVEVLEIPCSNEKIVYQRSVSYLEEINELLGIRYELMYSDNPSTVNACIKDDMYELILNLVWHIHEHEPDTEKSILIFLPNYWSIEKQWELLKPLESAFEVHILHRSIDTEQALMATKVSKKHKKQKPRKVILATNIAESSVTIPNVAFVIDSCRSLQVSWNKLKKKETKKLVWVSKSQAEQREGRTGRTCDGQVYRLVNRLFFEKLWVHESPAIQNLSLRVEALLLCCAGSEAINDPNVLLQKALDKPDPEVVEDALNTLVWMSALKNTTPGGGYKPTFCGRLLASFPLSFDAAVLILKFGDIGMIREGILLGIIMDMQPLPVIHPFGEEESSVMYFDNYFGERNILTKKKLMEWMVNFCAFEFWQHNFRDCCRLEHLKQVLKTDNVASATQLMPESEEDWLSRHSLSQSSLHQVSEIYDDILSSLHRFRPKILSSFSGLPSYSDPYEFKHICQDKEDGKCSAVPYVTSEHFHSHKVAESFEKIMKEISTQYTEDVSSHGPEAACVYFRKGLCDKEDSQCPYSHSNEAKIPPCKFFWSEKGCSKGESCLYSHDLAPTTLSFSSIVCLPEDNDINAALFLKLFPETTNRSVLIVDDNNSRFSLHFANHYDPSKIISTTCLLDTTEMEPSLTGGTPVPWNEIQCVLWFPGFDGNCEELDTPKQLLKNFFEHLSIRILADNLREVKVVITMDKIRFSQLQVEKLGRDCFFILTQSFAFDETSFGEVHDGIAPRPPTFVSRPISYVFELHPPSDKVFGDYAATIREHLHKHSNRRRQQFCRRQEEKKPILNTRFGNSWRAMCLLWERLMCLFQILWLKNHFWGVKKSVSTCLVKFLEIIKFLKNFVFSFYIS